MDRQEMFAKAGVDYRNEQQEQPAAPKPYVQPGQCFIHINGKRYRLAFTMLQMEIMQGLLKEQTTNIATGACLPYSALLMAARQAKTELDITFEDVLLWYDEAFTDDTEEYRHFDAVYKASNIYKKMREAEDEEEKKRSLSQMKQERLPQAL
jgi:hypothetical protein